MTCYQEITCPDCETKTFMLAYRYKACRPGIKEQVVEMSINGSGIRDAARVLNINKNTVISTLKKVEQHRPSKSKFSDFEFGSKFGCEIGIGL
ncbi:MAG: IS1-like element transposase [Methylobacter sp.]|jgi:transposase-like protein